MAFPPGLLVAVLLPMPKTVTPGTPVPATPRKVTVGADDVWAGAKRIKAIGLDILAAAIALFGSA